MYRLWDVVIALDDAAVVPLLSLELLRSRRFDLLVADRIELPEILSTIRIHAGSSSGGGGGGGGEGAESGAGGSAGNSGELAGVSAAAVEQVRALREAVLKCYAATPEALLQPLRAVCSNLGRDEGGGGRGRAYAHGSGGDDDGGGGGDDDDDDDREAADDDDAVLAAARRARGEEAAANHD